MKATAKPEFSRKWWTSEKPAEIKGVELERALASAEKALGDEQKKRDLPSIDACLAALQDLESAVDRTIKKECDKKQHKDVITVLGRYAGLIKTETNRLEGLKKEAAKSTAAGRADDGDGEEEEDEAKIFQKDYLYKMCKLLKSTGKELKFGFGLNSKAPEASQLVLSRKGKPERLFKALKKTGKFPSRLITHGIAVPDSQDGKTLVLKLAESAGEPPQIVKLGRRFLRADKNLRFRKLKLILPGGQTIEDTEPDTDDDAPLASAAAATASPTEATAAAAGPVTAEMENMRKEFKEARKRWVAARTKAEQDLEVVKDGVRNYYLDDLEQFPIAMNKLKELDEIMDNLNDELRDALDAYVSTPLKQQDRLRELGANARQVLGRFAQYVTSSPLLNAIDQREFADVQIKSPLVTAMRDLARTIK